MKSCLITLVSILFITLGANESPKVASAQEDVLPPAPPGLNWHFFNGEDGTPMVMLTVEEFNIHMKYVSFLWETIVRLQKRWVKEEINSDCNYMDNEPNNPCE